MTPSDERPGPTQLPVAVVPTLFSRIAAHSPELVVHIQHYLDENDEPLDTRQTYDGTDASARLTYLMAEVLLTFEKLRLELLDQSRPGPQAVPSNITLAMGEALRLEPAVLHMAKTALQVHMYVWNSHTLAPVDETSGRPAAQIDMGRWPVREEEDDG